jgi:hypothetical protein
VERLDTCLDQLTVDDVEVVTSQTIQELREQTHSVAIGPAYLLGAPLDRTVETGTVEHHERSTPATSSGPAESRSASSNADSPTTSPAASYATYGPKAPTTPTYAHYIPHHLDQHAKQNYYTRSRLNQRLL